jgi:FAD/FMN-containing dehydrogenase
MERDLFVSVLAAVVGDAHVLTDPGMTGGYETDFTRRFGGPARAVVRPGSPEEVAAVVAACAEAGVPIVPQGGNTGLVGGGVPRNREVVLSLRRLASVERVDPVAQQVTAGAGVTLAALQRAVRSERLDFGVDFAARDAATVGGMIATNAGGERVLRYGTMRACAAGVEAVLADGSVISQLAGLPKDNTGYDLTGLLVGNEGTLGVVTRARLRLVPLLPARATALVALPSLASAVELLASLRSLRSLEMAEFMLPAGLSLVCRHTGLPAPFAAPYGAYVLVECADSTSPLDALLSVLSSVPDALVAVDAADRQRLWTYREAHTEAISAAGVAVKLDVAVPLGALPAFVEDLEGLVAGRAVMYLFGHLAEGNVHVNLLAAESPSELSEAVLRRVAAVGGSISAEHGVGAAKARWLGLSRSPASLAAMRAIKSALDPSGLLNPGVLLAD